MRSLVGVLLTAWVALPAVRAAEPDARFGVEANLKAFPQSSPKEALASALKAADLKRFDYLLAHLADPEWVDQRVKTYGGKFQTLLKETKGKLDPGMLKRLRRFLKEGEFETLDTAAVVRHKDIHGRVVRFRKVGDRWFLRNQYK